MLQVNHMFLGANLARKQIVDQSEVDVVDYKGFNVDIGCCLCECVDFCMKKNSWRTGLCACWSCRDYSVGFGLASQSFVPCCAHVGTIEKLELADDLLLLCCGYLFCPICLCFPCVFFRHSYAKNMGLPEGKWFCGIVDTCCIIFFCFPCSMGQIQEDYQKRRVQNNKPLFKKAVTFSDYVHLWCGVITLENETNNSTKKSSGLKIPVNMSQS